MSYRGGRGRGRGRFQRENPVGMDEQSQRGRGNFAPSRHLWVGNISENITENDLAHHFLRFGNIESIAFQPGRSYAFINFRRDEEAFDALKALQGFPIGGNPLKIEFAKAEKSLNSAHNVEYSSRRDEVHSMGRDNVNMRDSRGRQSNFEASYTNKSKTSGKESEPSEILWIGFPEELKVDEFDLRKAFSSFGEIEKISVFPGRTYAFVRFRNIRSSCRAKETLQGKLFGDPRISICFARNESGGPNRERNLMDAPVSPHVRAYEHSRSPEHIRYDRNFGSMSSNPSNRIPNLDTRDHGVMGNLWPDGNDVPEHRRFPGQGPDLRLTSNIYKNPISPSREMGTHFDEFAPQKFPRQGRFNDPWDVPEDVSFLHEMKKRRRDSFPPDDLPEYPLSEMGNVKHAHPPDNLQSGVFNNNFDSRISGRGMVPDYSIKTNQPFGDRSDNWNFSTDSFRGPSSPLLQPDHTNEPSPKAVWKWEGMIAKAGNPVCRARCFPVGKPMEMALPEFIDCTSRTSLDMLAKQYYEAFCAWVVFFVPADDPDIPYYNEFMNFLGEKQRAAVATLDQQTSLFLVAPSEFSEKVLKVPGKLSISGVILRFGPSKEQLYDKNESAVTSYQSGVTFQNQISSSQPHLPSSVFTNYEKAGVYVAPNYASGHSMSSVHNVDEQRHDHFQKQPPGPIWSDHSLQNPSFSRNFTSGAHGSSTASFNQNYSSIPERMQEAPPSNYKPEMPGVPLSGNINQQAHSSMPVNSGLPFSGNNNQQAHSSMPVSSGVPLSGNINQQAHSSMPVNSGLPFSGNNNQQAHSSMPVNSGLPFSGNINQQAHSSMPVNSGLPFSGNYNQHAHSSMPVNSGLPFSGNSNQQVHSSMPVSSGLPFSGNSNQHVHSSMPVMSSGLPLSGNNNRQAHMPVNSGFPLSGNINQQVHMPVNSGVPLRGNSNQPVNSSMPVVSDVPLSENSNQQVHSWMPVTGIEPDKLAQLASSLRGQKNQFTYMPSLNMNQSSHSNGPQNSGQPADGHVSSESVHPVSGAAQLLPQVAPQGEVQAVGEVNQQVQNVGQEGQGDDGQRRLQATLALAASLLQQIQQGRGNSGK